ncbi:nucleoporin NIC96 (NIC96) [Vairimorpha necatrix]|uniref:Nuclear pore protein n=1 Tax=Vairimorpha necatrix TaxID=6039 RepID=A0AAX4JA02_9MICR
MTDKLKIPFVLESQQVTNYYQVVANLKKIQLKNKKYSVIPVRTNFTGILKPIRNDYNIESIINGFVYNKLQETVGEYEKEIEKNFREQLKKNLREIKKQNENLNKSGKNNLDVGSFEKDFGILPNEELFGNPMLFDIYKFLSTTNSSLDFDQEIVYLGIEYIKYIDRFLLENSSEILAPLNSFEDKVSVFVKMKYNSEEYKLEVFEGRYLFAEIYVYLRCGMPNSIFNLMNQYTDYFNNIENDFKKSFSSWLHSKIYLGKFRNINLEEDRFKKILYDLMEGKNNIQDHLIISSVEDYLWFQLMNTKDTNCIRKQFDKYKSKRGLLLVYVMTKQYDKAMEFCFYNDLSTFSTYHLMKELAKKSNDKNLFVDLTFMICEKMKDTQKKLYCISAIEEITEDYEEIVAKNIVKYKMFDILGLTLSKKIDYKVVRLLKDINDRKQIIKVYKLVDDTTLLTEILIDIFIEGILTQVDIQYAIKIFDEIKLTDQSTNVKKLEILLKFYKFLQSPDIFTLKTTSFFSVDFKLIEVKFVIEKVLKVACEVIKQGNDYEMAKSLFRVVGEIELSDECIKYLNRELVPFI